VTTQTTTFAQLHFHLTACRLQHSAQSPFGPILVFVESFPLSKHFHNQVMDNLQQRGIDDFLAGLSPWGLIYTRSRLREPIFGLSQLQHLPPEILCMVVPFLEWNDWLAAHLVSKSWQRSWSHPAVVVAFCQHLFPGLHQMHKSSLPPKQLLAWAIWNQSKWKHRERELEIIPWISSWSSPHFTNERRPALQQLEASTGPATTIENFFPVEYYDGLLAWQKDCDLAIIDDLRTRTRRRCALDSGLMSAKHLQIKGLSRKLLVFSGLGSNKLIVNTMFVFPHSTWSLLV
jgi:hypothetical protein